MHVKPYYTPFKPYHVLEALMKQTAKLLGNRFFFWGFAAGAIIGAAVGTAVTRSYSFNPVDPSSEVGVTDAFHRVYHNNWWNRTVLNTYWLGVQTMQCPLDMWVMQEIMYETRPDVVIETGTRLGGSALYFASIFDLLGRGRVISIDIRDYPRKAQAQSSYLSRRILCLGGHSKGGRESHRAR